MKFLAISSVGAASAAVGGHSVALAITAAVLLILLLVTATVSVIQISTRTGCTPCEAADSISIIVQAVRGPRNRQIIIKQPVTAGLLSDPPGNNG